MPLAPSSPVRILIAEDNPGDVRLIREALRVHEINHQLQVVADGEQAMAVLCSIANSVTLGPDLIFLDLNLPKTDGLDILRRIKQTPQIRQVPVIVLSSSESPSDRMETAELGANRYVRKPSTLDEFMAIGALAKELVPLC